MLRTGIIGVILAAICCFTPFLVVVFAFAGITAWLGWVDYALFPLMFTSMGVLSYGLYLRSHKVGPSPKVFLIAAIALFTGLLFWLEFKFALPISIAAGALVMAYAYYLHSNKITCSDSTPK